MIGPVLTSARDIDSFLNNTRAYPLVKVVDSWGIVDRAWNDADRAKLLANKTVILRTSTGDPSYRQGIWYPDTTEIIKNVQPWLNIKPSIIVELGNEPDVAWERFGVNEQLIWIYRYFLDRTVTHFRKEYPQVKLIAPCPRVASFSTWYRWIEIMADVLQKCDYLSAHVYGWHRLALDATDTQQFIQQKRLYDRLFPRRNVMVTECGIHDATMSASEKISQYRAFHSAMPTNWRDVLFYHYHELKDFDREYAVLP